MVGLFGRPDPNAKEVPKASPKKAAPKKAAKKKAAK
tara:strand:- start:72 stop:179 length:108 start_codon:yes stop_codon:yes gene_type:complete